MQASVAFINSCSVRLLRSRGQIRRLDGVSPHRKSEGNFVVVGLGWRRRFRWGRAGFATSARLSIFSGGLASSAGSAGTAPEQLHTLAYDPQFGSFLPSLLVIPAVHLQAALDENGPSFF
jgi:hypothetical protein